MPEIIDPHRSIGKKCKGGFFLRMSKNPMISLTSVAVLHNGTVSIEKRDDAPELPKGVYGGESLAFGIMPHVFGLNPGKGVRIGMDEKVGEMRHFVTAMNADRHSENFSITDRVMHFQPSEKKELEATIRGFLRKEHVTGKRLEEVVAHLLKS